MALDFVSTNLPLELIETSSNQALDEREHVASVVARGTRARAVALGQICLRRRLVFDVLVGAPPRQVDQASRRSELVHVLSRTIGALVARRDEGRELVIARERERGVLWLSCKTCLLGVLPSKEASSPFVALLLPDDEDPLARWRREVAMLGLFYESERTKPRQAAPTQPTIADRILGQFAIGVAIVDAAGRVSWLSPNAKAWVANCSSLMLSDGRLTSPKGDVRRKLAAAAAEAAGKTRRPAVLALPHVEDDRMPSLITFLPIGESNALVIFPAQSQDALMVDLLLDALGLTNAERRLARQLVMGRNLEDAAREANVTKETARSYLKRVFAKTGVKRQAELIALIASMTPPISSQDFPRPS